MSEKKIGPYKQALMDAEARANAQRRDDRHITYHEYPDYETYKEVQIAGNKAKIKMQFVKESHIKRVSDYLNAEKPNMDFGLCHGTRRGNEQAWFTRYLNGAPEVIGTDISETANEFANSVQWDFNKVNPEWANKADFIYSNSWDHAFDLGIALRAWADALKPDGVILIDHTKGQQPDAANALDPIGATETGLILFVNDELGDCLRVNEVLDYTDNREYRAKVMVLRRV